MSRNVADHQLDRTFVNTLNLLGRHQTASRSLQLQGSQSIRVATITGYQTIDIPDGTVAPTVVYLDFTDAGGNATIATLIRSTFMYFTDTETDPVNADLNDHGIGDDQWDIWLAYDGRDTQSDLSVDATPSETLDARVLAAMEATVISDNSARVGIRVSRITDDAKPDTLDTYVVFYQVRLTIG